MSGAIDGTLLRLRRMPPTQRVVCVHLGPMRTTWVALLCVAAIGCGDDGGGGGGGGTVDAAPSGPDAKQFLDGQPTMTVMVTVSGTAEEISTSGATPLAGVTIEAFRNANETTPIGTTTTDAQGNYTLTVAT